MRDSTGEAVETGESSQRATSAARKLPRGAPERTEVHGIAAEGGELGGNLGASTRY
jgi:hypothetical protein